MLYDIAYSVKKEKFNPASRKIHVNHLPLTLIEGAPACHQTWTASRGLHARGETHWGDTVGQDHWGCQLHQGYIVVKRLWVELQDVEKV